MKRPTAADLLTSLKRELALRNAVYPKRIESGKMKPETAQHEIACTQATIHYIKAAEQLLQAAIELWDACIETDTELEPFIERGLDKLTDAAKTLEAHSRPQTPKEERV